MRRTLLFLALALRLGAAVSPDYASRRAKLREDLTDGVLVLFGAKESEDLHYGFFQETNFLYLTGWEEPGAILVMTPEQEILMLPKRLPSEEKWTGRKLGPDDTNVRDVTGFSAILPAEKFESQLHSLLENYPKLYTVAGDAADSAMQTIAPLRTRIDAKPLIAKLRMEKSPDEIRRIQHATDASIEAHRAAWKMIRPGEYEYEVAAIMVGSYMMDGCRRSAYAPIVGSGPNSTTLHYSRNSRRMDEGEVVVMDVAGECENYASDITRTVPAGGKFTPRQREIYEIVLGAQRAAIAAVKPGMGIGRKSPNSLYQIAFDYINTHGKDLHGEPLGKYFMMNRIPERP